MKKINGTASVALWCALAVFFSSCSVNRMAVRAVADALTGDGSSTVFTGDSDPQLVGDAIPFAIKMYESLLAQAPDHQGLIVSTGSMFVMYANAFVQASADLIPPERFAEKQVQLVRAKNLYLRGYNILAGGLEQKFPGFKAVRQGASYETILKKAKKTDVAHMYWTAAASLAAFSLDPFDLQLGIKVPEARALMARAYALDPDYGRGTLDEFYILMYGALPPSLGGDREQAVKHFEKSLEKSKGQSAGAFISLANVTAIPDQDYPKFKELMNKALAIDVNANVSTRLANIISQRRARYLLLHAGDIFIDTEGDGDAEAK